jgi:hypothetical protein
VKLAMHRNQRLKIADWWQWWWHMKSSMWETWMRVCSYLGIIYWPRVTQHVHSTPPIWLCWV